MNPAAPPRVPATALAVGAIVSVQFGNAIAGSTFSEVGSLGAATLRLVFAAIILMAVIRPRVHDWSRRTWGGVVLLGLGLGGMNSLMYLSIDRIPIGIAVTVELLGPLAVAVAGTRRARDLAWVALAALGVVMLGFDPNASLAVDGIVFAGIAAIFWALYIVASSRLGSTAPGRTPPRGVDALAIAMVVAALIVTPFGATQAVNAMISNPPVIAVFVGIAVMTSAVPYALEFVALKTMSTRVFGVLSSLAPAAAALAGLLVLGQVLTVLQVVAVGAVIVASVGAVAGARPPRGGPEPLTEPGVVPPPG